ncbi:19011_t:CDS:2 [Dentiscutata erythropus]|uniref:19011_t:CDS:1 n=1 Tax=Dentiscutata erythropus TaxID=1348616 RepID=A0A9N9A6A1_9GLOM|nr:19011_t:CDS:2 [Dentiscutata erythropus]
MEEKLTSPDSALNIQDYESSETMQIDEEAVPKDFYSQQVQVQKNLIANRVLIVDWDTWKKCE